SVVEKEQQIVVQEREIQRREKELEATVKRSADAERYRIETEAAALRTRAEPVARGDAEAAKLKGLAQAEVIQATGAADASIVALRGAAEADAMRKKAESFKEYNEAAVLQTVLGALPEIARALAEPLSKTDRITMVSTGSSDGVGVSKLTADLAKVIAELPAVVESLSGVDLRRLIDAVPALRPASAESSRREPAAGESPAKERAAGEK
ncbi:MAG TPA: flotillin domain-containing protein, partial [Thermoanaerobaculia bacterium]|nr:flotillin domain-containing protein [Thermoanaerobaculia bacterium]